ncbi:hypothetical protein RxyAA322_18030 [Rubrobacter xylanophilus]|uniref:Rhodanese domain-containing protein n=1 Tax=Rubrobacter xylanophilus TaxID=49319 RepID=A0A510HIZ6_9ACTN|nr:rhodanese-like domain-containing protein [Rubrobacter xylanophilus]BBL79949.1 hypothetical protein RxyAA322_18030 [Rubrobacter xylanophilus]
MARSYEDLVAEARSQTRQVSPEEVHEALRSGEDITVVDVREPKEWSRGHIPGAKHIPHGVLEYRAASPIFPNVTPAWWSTAPPEAAAPWSRRRCRRWATPT